MTDTPRYDVKKATLDTMQAFISAWLDETPNVDHHKRITETGKKLKEECRIEVRLKSEIDAEIADTLRESVDEGPYYDCLDDGIGLPVIPKLRRLCAEPYRSI